MKPQQAATSVVLIAAVILAGCENVTQLPRQGQTGTVHATPDIIGRVVVLHFNGDVILGDPRCKAYSAKPRTARLWFIDANTIRGVREDISFDQPTEKWEYIKLSDEMATIKLWWSGGSYNEIEVTFTSKTSGVMRFFQRRTTRDPCGFIDTIVTGQFELEDPPE